MFKKYILGIFVALSIPMLAAYAAPTLTIDGSTNGTTGNVTVKGGDRNAPVVLYYTDANGATQSRSIGTTDENGYWNGDVNSANLSFNPSYPVYVMVNGAPTSQVNWPNQMTNANQVMFNNYTPSFAVGQNGTVSVLGAGGSYYIASNSNKNVNASLSDGKLSITGSQPGTSQVIVCSYSTGYCKNLNVTITGSNGSTTGSTGSPTLSQGNLSINQGGSGTITLSGGMAPYTVTVTNGTGVTTVLNGSTLTVNGNATGTNMVNICSSNGQCTPLSVSVNSSTNSGSTGGNSALSFTLALPYATTAKLMLNGGNGSYYLQSQSSSPIAASVSGNTLMMSGNALGGGTVTVCSNGATSCLPINVTVEQSAPLTGTGGGYFFDYNLGIGSTGQDVIELQTRLKAEGYFDAIATGYYGPITADAVAKYQAAHGIRAIGVVGPQTRAMLNQ